MFAPQAANKNQDKDKIKIEIANLITNLIADLNNVETECDKKINTINLERKTKKDEIVKKYSELYSNYFNN